MLKTYTGGSGSGVVNGGPYSGSSTAGPYVALGSLDFTSLNGSPVMVMFGVGKSGATGNGMGSSAGGGTGTSEFKITTLSICNS